MPHFDRTRLSKDSAHQGISPAVLFGGTTRRPESGITGLAPTGMTDLQTHWGAISA
jgi:hypothetical protein